jgi:hypothetical protein
MGSIFFGFVAGTGLFRLAAGTMVPFLLRTKAPWPVKFCFGTAGAILGTVAGASAGCKVAVEPLLALPGDSFVSAYVRHYLDANDAENALALRYPFDEEHRQLYERVVQQPLHELSVDIDEQSAQASSSAAAAQCPHLQQQ